MANVVIRLGEFSPRVINGGDPSATELQCDTPAKLDQAFRTVFRVRAWKLKIELTHEEGELDGSGKFTSSSTDNLQPEIISASPSFLGGEPDDNEPFTDETQLAALTTSWRWQDDSDRTTFTAELAYDVAADVWRLSFNLLLLYPLPDTDANGAQVSFEAAIFSGDEDEDNPQIITDALSFLGNDYDLLATSYNYPQATNSNDDPAYVYAIGPVDPHTHKQPAARLTLQSVKLDPQEYWSYGDTYDADTGAPTAN